MEYRIDINVGKRISVDKLVFLEGLLVIRGNFKY